MTDVIPPTVEPLSTGDAGVGSAVETETLENRVYLTRVGQFFGHAGGNMVMALVGAFLIALVLHGAGVSLVHLVIWFGGIVFLAGNVARIEHSFQKATLTPQNAPAWVRRRMISGSAVALMYGLAPFLFSADVTLASEMFIFIILSAMVAVGCTGYTTMPRYYLAIDAVTMVPLTLYLIAKNDDMHWIMAITSIIWQGVVLAKAARVSETSIRAIELNERLRDAAEEHKRTKDEMRHLAYHDFLTGLANRRSFLEQAGKGISRAKRSGSKVGFVMLDLDDFKDVNDTFGHEAGDLVLKGVARCLNTHVRDGDLVARLGGDEFCVVAEDIRSGEELERVAEKVSSALQTPIDAGGVPIVIGASVGIGIFPDNGDDIGSVMQFADDHMYSAKKEAKAASPDT